MARGRKKEDLTPEERLQVALVPESEQPYKVPENWCWTALKHISSHISDGSHNPPKDSGTGIPLLSATNIHDHLIDIDSAVRWITEDQWIIENQRTKIETNDVLLTIVASIGRTAVVKNEQFALQRSVAVIKPKINSEFLSYYFETPYIQHFMLDNAKGTAQKGFYLNSLAELFCCVPPRLEQQRIVDRIESLFAKLEEAKQKAQGALGSFETRKAAILHKAFTGKLTAQWREEHGVGMESWEKKALGDITDILSSKRIYKEEYTANGIPFFRSSEVVDLYDTGNTEPTFFISEQRYEEIKNQYGVPDVGDLLVTSVGTIGKTWIVDNRKFYYKDGNLTQVRKSKLLDMRFLQFYIMSPEFKEQIEETVSGSAYNALTIVKFKKIRLPVPSTIEQSKIVHILDYLLAKEQQAKEATEKVLEQIDLIKKSILSRAFRGELGTNDPREESAVELLNRIIERGE